MTIDYIDIRPGTEGWTLHVHDDNRVEIGRFVIGDAIQFRQETERTIGRWLADGPADFHTKETHHGR